jgi:hypothetical protein
MATIHEGRHALHGITVIVDTHGPRVFVGRCDDIGSQGVVLHDADEHVAGWEGRSKADYLRQAARYGVWKKHDRLVIPAADVVSVTRLADYPAR